MTKEVARKIFAAKDIENSNRTKIESHTLSIALDMNFVFLNAIFHRESSSLSIFFLLKRGAGD